jgi:phospholipid/cholesterol/gamma-HCH transport system substrate-binding protein
MYDVKKQLVWSKLKVGTVITSALVILLVTVFFAGDIENIISPKTLLKIDIKDVRGLRRGSPVWFSGLEVGLVKSIDLHPSYGTVVTISVERDLLSYLKKDTRATVQTMGLLGDKYIELSSGSPDAKQLQSGDMVEGASEISVQDVIETGTESLKKLTAVAEKLGLLVETVGESKGTISQLLKDPSLYDNLKDASRRISAMSADLQKKKGTLGKLIGDDLLYKQLVSATASMDAFGNKLNASNGTLNRLVEDSTLYDRLLNATSSLEDFSLKLTKGPGTLNRLAEDPRLYENLMQASEHLAAILHKIDSGDGTAGLLVRDDKLAQELKDTVKELKELTADVRENPGRYFKFSIF